MFHKLNLQNGFVKKSPYNFLVFVENLRIRHYEIASTTPPWGRSISPGFGRASMRSFEMLGETSPVAVEGNQTMTNKSWLDLIYKGKYILNNEHWI